MKTYHVDFFVNGEEYELDVPANKTALNVIRDMLDLTGAKEGCGAGECGACAMIVDGVLINGCLMLAPEMDGKHFETVEGFADEKGNRSGLAFAFAFGGDGACYLHGETVDVRMCERSGGKRADSP